MASSASAVVRAPVRPTTDRRAEAGDTHLSPGHRLFLEHLDTVERVIGRVSRRAGWFADDADDFRSWVFVRLLEDDCATLRRYRGQSTIRTYLTAVVTNLMRDYRNHRFGKWRPSGQARRLGPLAVDLDRLINRDSMTVDEAVRVMRQSDGCSASEAALRRLAARIPSRLRRTVVGSEALEGVCAAERADRRLWAAERARSQRELGAALEQSLQELDPEDQVILRLHYWNGLTIAEVSRSLGLPQKPLYPRVKRCLARLADALRSRGVQAHEVRDAITAR